MSKVVVTESYLNNIAEAIRAKTGGSATYTPGQMAAAIESIPTGGITPTGTVNITQNGTHDVTQYASANVQVPNTYEATDEGKVVSNGALVAQTSRNITENGTYDTTENDEVVVNVSGGGSGSYPTIDALLNGTLQKFVFYGANLQTASIYVKKFLSDYARVEYGSTKGTSSAPGDIAQTVKITAAILQSESAFRAAFPVLSSAEYYDYVYGKTAVINDLGLVLLGDFSQGGAASGNTLSDAITNYSAVLLQGIYQKNRTSQYNTSMLYINPILNTAYWTGMKDRNNSYDCNVTFTDASTVSLTGNRQVIIYGMP